MSLHTCIVDLRGKDGWTLAQRKRKADLGLVSPTWTMNPLGFVPKVGPHTAPGWGEYDGAPPTDPIYAEVKALSDSHPFPDRQPLVLYTDTRYFLYGLNLASPGCGEKFAELLTSYCAWADLCCLDYYCAAGDPLAMRPGGLPRWATQAWFDDFTAGSRMLSASIKRLRPDWTVYGYDWNWHKGTSALDGIFVEDRYTRNQPLDQTAAVVQMMKNDQGGISPDAILEMRVPASYSQAKTKEIEAACEYHGWALSRGKDATAVGG